MSTNDALYQTPTKRSNVVRVLHWGDNPAVITALIGSMRFKSEFDSVARTFAQRGEIVLAPHVYSTNMGLDKDDTDLLHEMALKRIEMADKVFVINPNNKMNEHVYEEIEYAHSLHRTVTYLDTPAGK